MTEGEKMRKPRIYLETTMFNYYFEADRDAHSSTVKLFEKISVGEYEAYTSGYVISELENAQEPKRSNMLGLISKYNINVLAGEDEARRLAGIYVKDGVIPAKYTYDGLHIAIATTNDIDYIFSLNFKHINKLRTKTMTSVINVREGYRQIVIASPMEVVEDEE
jgi:predicted nucleic acid-binding protein